jgi:hypothetical protein
MIGSMSRAEASLESERFRGNFESRYDDPGREDPYNCTGLTLTIGKALFSRPEWHLVERIIANRKFLKSEFLPKFLRYVCERQLTGRSHEITETWIGIHVFQRPPNYNPAEDNIVRSYARTLRRRLDEYFQNEGSQEPIRIVIPRGGYVPIFETAKTDVADESELRERPKESFNEGRTKSRSGMILLAPRPNWKPMVWGFVAGLVAGALMASVCWSVFRPVKEQSNRGQTTAISNSHAVWAKIFEQNRDTLLVPTDSGLGILENFTRQPVNLASYMSAGYLQNKGDWRGLDAGSISDLRTQQYTSVVALNIIFALAHLPEFDFSRSRIRYPRDVSTSDLKHSNVVLLGSAHANPWVTLFDKNLNFRLTYLPEVDNSFVLNEHPTKEEQTIYRNEAGTANHRTYAVIDYLPNLDGAGHVLILQGLTMAGTQVAADMLFHSKALQPILERAMLPDGSLKPFEVLIETSTIGADAPEGRIIGTRFYPA